jgi:hypothetical protein
MISIFLLGEGGSSGDSPTWRFFLRSILETWEFQKWAKILSTKLSMKNCLAAVLFKFSELNMSHVVSWDQDIAHRPAKEW